jgi:hypothetical protein
MPDPEAVPAAPDSFQRISSVRMVHLLASDPEHLGTSRPENREAATNVPARGDAAAEFLDARHEIRDLRGFS